jgi:hypothetical protein
MSYFLGFLNLFNDLHIAHIFYKLSQTCGSKPTTTIILGRSMPKLQVWLNTSTDA